MGYVAVSGGRKAIENAGELFRHGASRRLRRRNLDMAGHQVKPMRLRLNRSWNSFTWR